MHWSCRSGGGAASRFGGCGFGIGASLVRTHCDGATTLPSVEKTMSDAVDRLGPTFDYTGVVKHIEEMNDVDLRSA